MKRKKQNNRVKKRNNKKRKINQNEIGSMGYINWSEKKVNFNNEERDSESEEEEVPLQSFEKKKKKSKIKVISKNLKDELILKKERELLDDSIKPQTKEDFERLLFSEPNNSYLWIQFMSYELSMSNVEGAKQVCQKALKKISSSFVNERLNIFLALMNLENKYGSKDSKEKVLEYCVKNCGKRKSIYLHQTKLYEENKEKEKCENLYKRVLKKYCSKKCFLQYGLYLMRQGRYAELSQLLDRILNNFPQEKRFQTATKIAINCYKFGSFVEGHKTFQYLVQKFPKRTDIWSQFIQMELNSKRYEEVRKLYQRVISLKLSKFKKERYFKRFYAFEEKYGTKENIEDVKVMAREFKKG